MPEDYKAQAVRRLCDAYIRALIVRRTDSPPMLEALKNVPLPPGPAERWFWERVAEEYDKWEPEETDG